MVYQFEWSGAHISLNAWYSAASWVVRANHKYKWHGIFKELIEQQEIEPIEQYKIKLKYNSRLDPTNTITMIKLFEDTMVELGVIKGDSKKYCKGVEIMPVEELESKQYIIEVEKIK